MVSLVLFALALSAAQAPAQTAAPPDPAEEARLVRVRDELQALRQALNEAVQRRDRAALERLYAPEFRFIHASGYSDDREAQIRGILESTTEFRGLPPFDFGPNTLLVATDDMALVRNRSRPPLGRELWISGVYARRDGGWQIVQLQGTEINPARTAAAVPPARLQPLAGNYRQSNGNQAVFTLEGDQLFVQFPNRPRWPLTAVGEDHFFDRSDNEYSFFRDTAGRVTHYVITLRHRETQVRGEPMR